MESKISIPRARTSSEVIDLPEDTVPLDDTPKAIRIPRSVVRRKGGALGPPPPREEVITVSEGDTTVISEKKGNTREITIDKPGKENDVTIKIASPPPKEDIIRKVLSEAKKSPPKSSVAIDLPTTERRSPPLSPRDRKRLRKELLREEVKQEKPASSMTELIDRNNVDIRLINNGFIPVQKVIVGDLGEQEANYIKAVTKMGQYVYVQLDRPGFTSVNPNDLTMERSSAVSIIPYSVKIGARDCMGNTVCGTLFECGSDGICTLIDGDTPEKRTETTFHYLERPGSRELRSGNKIISYPVVRLSEIEANPTLVTNNVNVATHRIRNESYSKLMDELRSTGDAVTQLGEAISSFTNSLHTDTKALSASLKQLETIAAACIDTPPTTEEDREKMRLIHYNLRRRSDMVVDLLQAAKNVSLYKDQLVNMRITTDSLRQQLSSTFKGVSSVIRP